MLKGATVATDQLVAVGTTGSHPFIAILNANGSLDTSAHTLTGTTGIFNPSVNPQGDNIWEGVAVDSSNNIFVTGQGGGFHDIRPESAATLEQVMQLLKNDPDLKLEVAGHTDNTGDKAHNQMLSEGRANAVVVALVTKYGIDAGRLEAKGYGQDKPVASNDTEAGKAKNRRVELRKL